MSTRDTTLTRTIGEDLTPNGGFETGTTGWTAISSTISQDSTHTLHSQYACKCVTSNLVAAEGLGLSSTTPPSVFADLIPVTPGVVYTLAFAVYGSGTLTGVIDTYAYDLTYLGSAVVGPFTPTAAWVNHEVSKAMSAEMLYVNIRFLTDVKQTLTFWVDNVTFCRSDRRVRIFQDATHLHFAGAGGGI